MWYWINGNNEVVAQAAISASLERNLVVMQGIDLYCVGRTYCHRTVGNGAGNIQRLSIDYEQDVPERIRMHILLTGD